MTTLRITTPTGLVVDVRHYKGLDLRDAMREQKTMGAKFDMVTFFLDRCVTQVVDYGPVYSHMIGGKPPRLDYRDLLSGDRYHLVLKLRQATHGENYQFKVPCASCRDWIYWGVNLNELDMRPLPDDHLKMLQDGKNAFPVETPWGDAEMCYGTGRTEQRQSADNKPYGTFHATIMNRCLRVGDAVGREKILKRLDEEPGTMVDDLFAIVTQFEFGVQTRIGVVCQASPPLKADGCGARTTVTLPFDLPFLMPKSASLLGG